MAKTAAQLDQEIEQMLRVEVSDQGRPTLTFRRGDYRDALRDAAGELLGSGGDRAQIYQGDRLLAEGGLQRRRVRSGGQKYSARFSGEKPRRR